MKLRNFLDMYVDSCALITIKQLPYNHNTCRFKNTYFEECRYHNVISSDIFREISGKQVDYFQIIGGGEYPVELCIYLKEGGGNE